MAIPFKSLRFPSTSKQTWGIIFNREIPRLNEDTYWPHISSRIEGQLNQSGSLEGLENISPGRNLQMIPYGVFRSFRALDTRDPLAPRFVRERADFDAGLDAKFVLKDSLVLDVALNPDFSQVESDEPQVTVNERFEVFFPEKRPFFLENASYFQTPIALLFTRRIADPQFGVRLTGKVGPWALGAFVMDDESPGKRVPPGDPLHGKRAYFGIVRINRDIGRQSTLGLIFTDREFENSFNRIGGLPRDRAGRSSGQPRVQTQGAGAEIGDEQCAPQHRHVLEEHDLLHLGHHGVLHRPEVVHHDRDGHQKDRQRPRTQLGLVAQQHAQSPHQGQQAGDRDQHLSHRHPLLRRVADGLLREVAGRSDEEDRGKQRPPDRYQVPSWGTPVQGLRARRARVVALSENRIQQMLHALSQVILHVVRSGEAVCPHLVDGDGAAAGEDIGRSSGNRRCRRR